MRKNAAVFNHSNANIFGFPFKNWLNIEQNISASENIAELLIKNGADVNFRDKKQRSPLYWAVALGNSRFKKTVKRSKKLLITQSISLLAGNEKIAKILIEHKANVNLAAKKKRTMLSRAVALRNFWDFQTTIACTVSVINILYRQRKYG